MIFFKVCLVTGLVLSSPWTFYQVWAFIAAGLYRRERMFVYKFLPCSLGLFLAGVFICFFAVLPLTLRFLLEFNVWLGVTPMLRLNDWMGFATILPLVFGLCFQTPLVMLFLSIIGVFTAADYRAKRRLAILVIVIVAPIVTPGPDVSSMLFLCVPMFCYTRRGFCWSGSGGRRSHCDSLGHPACDRLNDLCVAGRASLLGEPQCLCRLGSEPRPLRAPRRVFESRSVSSMAHAPRAAPNRDGSWKRQSSRADWTSSASVTRACVPLPLAAVVLVPAGRSQSAAFHEEQVGARRHRDGARFATSPLRGLGPARHARVVARLRDDGPLRAETRRDEKPRRVRLPHGPAPHEPPGGPRWASAASSSVAAVTRRLRRPLAPVLLHVPVAPAAREAGATARPAGELAAARLR